MKLLPHVSQSVHPLNVLLGHLDAMLLEKIVALLRGKEKTHACIPIHLYSFLSKTEDIYRVYANKTHDLISARKFAF